MARTSPKPPNVKWNLLDTLRGDLVLVFENVPDDLMWSKKEYSARLVLFFPQILFSVLFDTDPHSVFFCDYCNNPVQASVSVGYTWYQTLGIHWSQNNS